MLIEITEPETSIQKNQHEKIVGIDFGTTNSLIAYGDENGIIVIKDNNGHSSLKSIIKYNSLEITSIKRLFGKNLQEIQNSSYISQNIKNKISLNSENNLVIQTDNNHVLPIEIAAEIFKTLKKNAENFLKEKITKAVVTVPAYFDDAAKTMVKDSARLAGFEVLRLVAEPTAAAYSYSLENKEEGNYLVYDIGGGTFDVSILAMRMGAFQVLAIGGNPELGGDDIDFAIANFLKDKEKLTIDAIEEQKFLELCRNLKEQTSKSYTAIEQWEEKNITLEYNELNKISTQLLKPTINITKRAIRDSGLESIDGIILVGGTTKLDIVKELLRNEFPDIKIIDNVDPDKAVVIGAAMQARNLAFKTGDILIDVIPLSLGLELMGGVVEKIIPRNTPIPASVTNTYTTYADNQTGFDFHIVQGDRELAADCRSLAKFSLKGIPPMLAGKATVEVIFNIDSDGLLEIKAKELTSGIKQEVIVKPSFGLTTDKIITMLKSAMENAEQDHENSLKAAKKVELEAVINRLLILFEQYPLIITDSELNMLKNECIDLQAKIKSLNSEELNQSLEILEKKSAHFIEKIMSNELSSYLSGKSVEKIL